MTAIRAARTLRAATLSAAALLALGARGLEAQASQLGLSQLGIKNCYAGVPGADAKSVLISDATALARTADAERGVALQELAAGKALAAVERLERFWTPGQTPSSLGPVVATLANAYERAGCRAAFIEAATWALTTGLPQADAAELRTRLALALGARLPAVDAAPLPRAATDSEATPRFARSAWASYGAKAYDSAAADFQRAATAAPGAPERWELRLMEAQSLLEAGKSGAASTLFRETLDSARALGTSIDSRVGAGGLAAIAKAAANRRALGVMWAGDAVDGRLVAVSDNGVGLRTVTRSEISSALAALSPANDPVVRALVWTPGGENLGGLRALIDTIAEADARVARAKGRSARLIAERPAKLADAAAYVASVRGMKDSLDAADKVLTAFGDSVARRDSAIQRTITDYRALITQKIQETQKLAAQNRARIDSLEADARRTGDLTTRFLTSEQGTATEYLAVADAASSALERGITRLDIVFQRDTVHQKYAKLTATMREARAAYDTSLGKATDAQKNATAALDQVAQAAADEVRTAQTWQAETVDRAATDAAATLASRAEPLKARLDGIVHAASYGLGSALFFAAIEGDTVKANAADVVRRRDAAIAAMADALAGHSQSPMRPALLLQTAELLTRKADADFATAQRAGGRTADAADHPDYAAAIARYDELLKTYPNDPQADIAAYTLGTLAFAVQRYDDAARAFAMVMAKPNSPFRAEAYFRDGDSRFEQAVKLAGDARHSGFGDAAGSYDKAISLAPRAGDIYFLALYKLGWSDYMQAERQSSEEYRKAVDVFARLVREVDSLPPERQARLALRHEAIDYLAIAITQLGGPDEAVKYLGTIPDNGTRMLVLRRVADALRDQGEFASSVIAFRGAIDMAPLEPTLLETRRDLVDLYQSRMLEPARAQEARLELVEALGPSSAWGKANPDRSAEAQSVRERTLREAGSYALTEARKLVPAAKVTGGTRPGVPGEGSGSGARRGGTVTATTPPAAALVAPTASTPEAQSAFANAAGLFTRYMAEFSGTDSGQRVSALEGDSRFGARDWFAAGNAYARTSTKWTADTNALKKGDATLASAARRNAVVAYDSAVAAARRANPSAPGAVPPGSAVAVSAAASASSASSVVGSSSPALDSLIAATERYVASAQPEEARQALIVEGRRASEAGRWETVANAFTRVADQWPNDPIAPEARKFVGDARYKQGRYTDAQAEWKRAQEAAAGKGRKALADSIVNVRVAAASQAADSLTKQGAFVAAADSILTGIASDIGDPARAADVLRNAVEVHLAADSTQRAKGDTAGANASRLRAIAAIETLAGKYPNYQHTLTYNALRAKLLTDAGRPADGADALIKLAASNPTLSGRADAMVRAAFLLDSVGKSTESAAAYERFSAAYPNDKRAPDAAFNAAVILRDAKDNPGAVKAYKTFITRFPKDPRVAEANLARWTALKASGDSVALSVELATLCAGWKPPTSASAVTPYTPVCADRAGSSAFREGMAAWDRYAAMKLEIKTKAQLTQTGVAAASAQKLTTLRAMTAAFTRAIGSGASEWVSAGTFQTGLAQWYYGLFLRDVVLPADITDAQRTGATNGSAQQAQQYFDQAIKTWGALVDKATAGGFTNPWVDKAKAAMNGEGVPARSVTP